MKVHSLLPFVIPGEGERQRAADPEQGGAEGDLFTQNVGRRRIRGRFALSRTSHSDLIGGRPVPGLRCAAPGMTKGGAELRPTTRSAVVGKGLTLKTGQTHVQTYLESLMRKIEEGLIDPGVPITHKIELEDGPDMDKTFQEKKDSCVKIVINP